LRKIANTDTCWWQITDQKPSHQGVIFRPLEQRLAADSWAAWNANNASDCLKQYIQIVKELS
jgi:hypothetical protein